MNIIATSERAGVRTVMEEGNGSLTSSCRVECGDGYDIRDDGKGQRPNDMPETLLSLVGVPTVHDHDDDAEQVRWGGEDIGDVPAKQRISG